MFLWPITPVYDPAFFMDERTHMGMHGSSQLFLSVNKSTAEGLTEIQRGEFKRRLWINIKYKVLEHLEEGLGSEEREERIVKCL